MQLEKQHASSLKKEANELKKARRLVAESTDNDNDVAASALDAAEALDQVRELPSRHNPDSVSFTFGSDAGHSSDMLPYQSPFDDDNDSVSEASSLGLGKSLEHDLFCIEVAAFVDTIIAVGTASVIGRQHDVNEQMCLAVALQVRRAKRAVLQASDELTTGEEHASQTASLDTPLKTRYTKRAIVRQYQRPYLPPSPSFTF